MDELTASVLAVMNAFSALDIAALTLFLAAWMGYSFFTDRSANRRSSLMDRMHEYREAWTRQMLKREMRMVDIQIIMLLVHNVSFFASASILIIGGFVAVLGAGEAAREILADLPFADETSVLLWDFKIILMILIFIYAFFKFTWSLRQFNYVAVLLGALPVGETDATLGHATLLAQVTSRAGDHFNRAMRAYYFGMAALAWFIQPVLFMAATLWVLSIVHRREYRSQILDLLGRPGDPLAGRQ